MPRVQHVTATSAHLPTPGVPGAGLSNLSFTRLLYHSDVSLSVSPKLLRYKQHVRDQLVTESGVALMKRRGIEVESVFGQIKGD
ncbi:hypothetical protein BXT84_03150 [Sulfobacillus thermotolerans]|uniref:Transposase DDE domain-containing protein n=1 Tax=Sulfobacillus thermotolerans TaxID=338644 RepID=A0ABM6RNX6_9FIRM|nr:hypothetical protein BXT84_03150 [Sulfobacillus thermotolerans]